MAGGNANIKGRYKDGVLNRFFFANITTRAARPWTSLFVALRMSPNQVSLTAFVASCAGLVALLGPAFPFHRAVAAALLLLSLVWDHSDGQVARRTGTGSVLGGLVDSIFDRFVETSWVVGLAVYGLRHPEGLLWDWTPVAVLVVASAACFANLYLRWSTAIKNLAPLHQGLKRAFKQSNGQEIRIPVGPQLPSGDLGRTVGIPFFFNRDVTIWMLAALCLVPDVPLGLAVFALAHLGRAFELNWYTRNHLKDENRALWKVLDPDFH